MQRVKLEVLFSKIRDLMAFLVLFYFRSQSSFCFVILNKKVSHKNTAYVTISTINGLHKHFFGNILIKALTSFDGMFFVSEKIRGKKCLEISTEAIT